MPSKSKKQHNFMAAVAHSPEFAKKAGVPMSVGKDFNEADKGKKFSKGGRKSGSTNPSAAKIANPRPHHGKIQLPNVGIKKYAGFKEGGIMKPVDKEKNPGMAKLPTAVRNKMGYMKDGGMAHSDIAKDKPMMKKVAGEAVKGHEKRMHKMAAGGKAGQLSKANGIAVKGKSKGTMISMKKGGSC
jgi:hypothetical protein